MQHYWFKYIIFTILFSITLNSNFKKEPIPILSLNSIFSNCKKVGFYCDCFTPRHHLYGWWRFILNIMYVLVKSILWQHKRNTEKKKIKYFSLGCSFYSQFKNIEKAIKINHFFHSTIHILLGNVFMCYIQYAFKSFIKIQKTLIALKLV